MQMKMRVKEGNVSPDNVDINRSGHKDWCICGCCKKEIREIDCLCCQEVAAISEVNFSGNQCITMSKQFQTLCLEKLVVKMFWLHYMKLKEENKTKSKTDHCALLPLNNLYGEDIKNLGKERREFSYHLWKIRQHYPEANRQYILYNER